MPETLAPFDCALPDGPDDARARLLAHRALCLRATGGTGTDDLDGVLNEAVAPFWPSRGRPPALVAIGDEPLGMSVHGNSRGSAACSTSHCLPTPALHARGRRP
jgi:hypothetical protein